MEKDESQEVNDLFDAFADVLEQRNPTVLDTIKTVSYLLAYVAASADPSGVNREFITHVVESAFDAVVANEADNQTH